MSSFYIIFTCLVFLDILLIISSTLIVYLLLCVGTTFVTRTSRRILAIVYLLIILATIMSMLTKIHSLARQNISYKTYTIILSPSPNYYVIQSFLCMMCTLLVITSLASLHIFFIPTRQEYTKTLLQYILVTFILSILLTLGLINIGKPVEVWDPFVRISYKVIRFTNFYTTTRLFYALLSIMFMTYFTIFILQRYSLSDDAKKIRLVILLTALYGPILILAHLLRQYTLISYVIEKVAFIVINILIILTLRHMPTRSHATLYCVLGSSREFLEELGEAYYVEVEKYVSVHDLLHHIQKYVVKENISNIIVDIDKILQKFKVPIHMLLLVFSEIAFINNVNVYLCTIDEKLFESMSKYCPHVIRSKSIEQKSEDTITS